MPPTGYFGSRLRRSIVLASFVRALAEAGSRCWSADKLSAGSQCQWCNTPCMPRAACAQSRFSVDASYPRVRYFEKQLVSVSGSELLTRDEAKRIAAIFCEAAGAIARAGGIDDFLFQFRASLTAPASGPRVVSSRSKIAEASVTPYSNVHLLGRLDIRLSPSELYHFLGTGMELMRFAAHPRNA